MDILFVRHGEYLKGDEALPLIREAERMYFQRSGRTAADADCRRDGSALPAVERDEYGRLSFVSEEKCAPDLSVTHSGDVWMCLMSDSRCGVDFQYTRKQDTAELAARYYTEGEQKYIQNGGEGRFFDIWVRREALGKYEGHGFFGDYPDTAPEGELPGSADFAGISGECGRMVFIHEITESMLGEAGIDITGDFRAAAVTESEEAPLVQVI